MQPKLPVSRAGGATARERQIASYKGEGINMRRSGAFAQVASQRFRFSVTPFTRFKGRVTRAVAFESVIHNSFTCE